VVASAAVALCGIRANPATRIADTRNVALVLCDAADRGAGRTSAGLAGVVLGAGAVVGVATSAVGFRWIRTETAARAAATRVVALIGGRTCDGWPRRANTGLAGVVLSAGVAVGVARSSVDLDGSRAHTGRRIAGSLIM